MKKLIRRVLDSLFILIFARRAALRLRSYLPLLGMTADEMLMIPAQTGSSGVVKLTGFTTPTISFDAFHNEGKKGWKAEYYKIFVNAKGRLERETSDGVEVISFFDSRALPVVRFLQSITLFWPYSIYMTIEQSQYARRLPPVKG